MVRQRKMRWAVHFEDLGVDRSRVVKFVLKGECEM
jgi:hypothetical protein